MRALYPILERIIQSDSTVLIHGESGTGKELVAHMIHYNSNRKDARFVVVDCGATPASLIESELFGHARGSFTNAIESRKGMFEVADQGTLFLDEVGTMPLDLQTRLLRVLQEGQIKRVGENVMRGVDVRVIAATNMDLRDQVSKGLFRLDLYYRMAVLHVEVPPLRERKEDIPMLAEHFLESFSRRMRREPMKLGPGALGAFLRYPWPGNVRELKNAIEAAVVLARGNVLEVEDLLLAGFPRSLSPSAPAKFRDHSLSGTPLPKYLEQQERELVLTALRANDWVQKDAARQLGISPRVLCYKIKRLKIELPGTQTDA